MGKLFPKILRGVHDERYVIGQHANERLRERHIPAWQVLSGLEDGTLLKERPDAMPNPVVEVRQVLADGTRVIAVWAWLQHSRTVKLVTVHFIDG